jgi:phosphoglycolate phosphatase-like HAD superfamily hydrolase
VRLVLFDIDGTLLRTDGAGRTAMEAALIEHFGVAGVPGYRYDGKTDRQIVREQMRVAGFDDATIDARFPALIERYLERLDAALTRDPAGNVVCAGIPPLLARLAAEPRVTLGLLTGNVARGARRKLDAVGLDFGAFRVGAFGCDHEHRPELPAIAQRRAREALGLAIAGDQLVIIGDTPADIHCGRALGVRAIGVATGRYTVEQLAEHAPAHCFATLEDTDAVCRAILA